MILLYRLVDRMTKMLYLNLTTHFTDEKKTCGRDRERIVKDEYQKISLRLEIVSRRHWNQIGIHYRRHQRIDQEQIVRVSYESWIVRRVGGVVRVHRVSLVAREQKSNQK